MDCRRGAGGPATAEVPDEGARLGEPVDAPVDVVGEGLRHRQLIDVQLGDPEIRAVVGLKRPEREEALGAEMLLQVPNRREVEPDVAASGGFREREEDERVAGDEQRGERDADAPRFRERGRRSRQHDRDPPGDRPQKYGWS